MIRVSFDFSQISFPYLKALIASFINFDLHLLQKGMACPIKRKIGVPPRFHIIRLEPNTEEERQRSKGLRL